MPCSWCSFSLFCACLCILSDSIDMKSLKLKLESLHPGKVLKTLVENNRRQMGFSGATVYEVSAIWEEHAKAQDLFVKEISLIAPAESSARMKHERNIRSYYNEIFFLKELAPSLREAGVTFQPIQGLSEARYLYSTCSQQNGLRRVTHRQTTLAKRPRPRQRRSWFWCIPNCLWRPDRPE